MMIEINKEDLNKEEDIAINNNTIKIEEVTKTKEIIMSSHIMKKKIMIPLKL